VAILILEKICPTIRPDDSADHLTDIFNANLTAGTGLPTLPFKRTALLYMPFDGLLRDFVVLQAVRPRCVFTGLIIRHAFPQHGKCDVFCPPPRRI
jgi:hypothetical protein